MRLAVFTYDLRRTYCTEYDVDCYGICDLCYLPFLSLNSIDDLFKAQYTSTPQSLDI